MTRQTVELPGVDGPILPLSSAVWAGDLLFVSGQASTTPTGDHVPGTFAEEFQRTVANVRMVLERAGLTLDHVVQVNAYLAHEASRSEFNTLYREVFASPFPARTTIACGIAQLQFEMDVIAHGSRGTDE